MKIRIIAVLYTIVILISGVLLWNKIDSEKAYFIDMLDLNTKRDEIEAKLLSGADIAALESEYNCSIVLVADDGYESLNNYFIKEGMSVFDYREDGAIAGKIAFNARAEEYAARTRNAQIQLLLVLGHFRIGRIVKRATQVVACHVERAALVHEVVRQDSVQRQVDDPRPVRRHRHPHDVV